MRYSIAALAFVGAISASFAARAEESSEKSADVEAAALFHDAEARYVAGDVAGAFESMQRSYALSGRAELLFNLGELRRELGRCEEARRDYEAYLERVSAGARREQAREALEALRIDCPNAPNAPSAASVPPASSTSPVAPPVPRGPASVAIQSSSVPPVTESNPSVRPLTIAAWSAIGVGVLAGVGATLFALQAANHERRLESRIDEAKAKGGVISAADQELELDGARAAKWARVLGIGAAGFTAAGVSLLVFGENATEANQARVSIEWRGGGASAVYGQRF